MNEGPHKHTVIGDYLLLDYLGGGGMGDVYRAVHKKIGRVVAVKKLRTEEGNYVKRFFNEARIQARLQHPNIATLYDYLEHDGHPHIVMEYVDGRTLDDCLQASQRFAVAEAIEIFRGVAEAIAYLHQHGIIHRDIKPNNIKITSSGQVKLLDFGIAKIESADRMTTTGGVIGTLPYLAPEQLKGGEAGVCSDVWQLGILLYELLAGVRPFDGVSREQLWAKIIKASYPPVTSHNSAVPREVEAIVSRCLKKNAADRYSSVQQLLQDVEPLLRPAPRKQSAPASPTKSAASGKKNWLTSAVIVVLGIGLAALLWLLQPSVPPVVSDSSPIAVGTEGEVMEIKIRAVEGEGVIKVYSADGEELLGATPHSMQVKLGEQVNLQLRGEGFETYRASFSVAHGMKEYKCPVRRIEKE